MGALSIILKAALAGLLAFVVGFSIHGWLIRAVSDGIIDKLIYTSLGGHFLSSFYLGLSLLPVGSAMYLGFRQPKSNVKGFLTVLAALTGGVACIFFKRAVFASLEIEGLPILLGVEDTAIHQIGITASVCAFAILLWFRLWGRKKAPIPNTEDLQSIF